MTVQTQTIRSSGCRGLPVLATRTDCKGCMWLLQPHSGEDRWTHSSEGWRETEGEGELQLSADELDDGCAAVGTTQSL